MFGLGLTHAVGEPRDELQLPGGRPPGRRGPASAHLSNHGQGHSEIDALPGVQSVEPRRRHADHAHRVTADRQQASDDAGIAAEPPLPERMAQDHDGVRPPRPVVLDGEQAADGGRDAQDLEEPTRHELTDGRFAEAVDAQRDALHAAAGQHATDQRPLDFEPAQDGVGEADAAAARLVAVRQRHQAVRPRHRQRRQQQAMHQAEDRAVGADADSQCDHDDRRERRGPSTQAQGVRQVAAEIAQPRPPATVLALFDHLIDAAEREAGPAARFLGRQAVRHPLTDQRREVVLQLAADTVPAPSSFRVAHGNLAFGVWSGLAARGGSAASHRDGRGARRSRREEGEYREYSTDEQRRAPGWIARRMQRDFHHGLLALAVEDERHRVDEPAPRLLLVFELLPAGPGDGVDLGLPSLVGIEPRRLQPAALLEAMQRRVERALPHQEGILRDLLDALRDAVAVRSARAPPPAGRAGRGCPGGPPAARRVAMPRHSTR